MRTILVAVWLSTNLGDPILGACAEALLSQHDPKNDMWRVDLTGQRVTRRRDGTYAPMAAEKEKEACAALPTIRHLQVRTVREHVSSFAAKHTGRDPLAAKHGRQAEEAAARFAELLDSARAGQACVRVVFAGGQLFFDYYGLTVAAFVRLCEARHIPVYCNACGTGKFTSPTTEAALAGALALPCVQQISVRDGAAALARWPLGKPIAETFDPALFAAQVYGFAYRTQAADWQSRPVGLGPIYSMALPMGRNLRFWERLIRYLDAAGIPWQLFGNGNAEDLAVMTAVYRRVRPQAEAPAVCSPRTPGELLSCIAACRGLISCRLHSHILAYALGVPAVAVAWDDKVPAFAQKAGRGEACVDLRTPPADIWSKFLAAEAAPPAKARLHAQQEELRRMLVACGGEAVPMCAAQKSAAR